MEKGEATFYGTATLAKKLNVSVDRIKYLMRTGQVTPKKEIIGKMTFNAYTHADVEYIKEHAGRK